LNPTDWKVSTVVPFFASFSCVDLEAAPLHLFTISSVRLQPSHSARDYDLSLTSSIDLSLTDRDFVSPKDARLGCDFAGTVDTISEGVDNVKIGDRVAGFVHGGRWEEIGSFTGESRRGVFVFTGSLLTNESCVDYVKTDSTLVWKVPENISWEEAAASGGIAPRSFASHSVDLICSGLTGSHQIS